VPATVVESPGTRAPVFVSYPTAEQLELLSAQELNYDLVAFGEASCRLESGGAVSELAGYRSIHGCLSIDGSTVALAAVRAVGRTLPQLDERAVLERVRSHLEPELTLEEFIRACVERGGIKPLRIGAGRLGR
jgi:hypothetical protein